MINNRKTIQKVVASIAVLGVAASGAISFFSMASAQQPTQQISTSNDVNLGTQTTLPVTPNLSATETALPIAPDSSSTTAPLTGQ